VLSNKHTKTLSSSSNAISLLMGTKLTMPQWKIPSLGRSSFCFKRTKLLLTQAKLPSTARNDNQVNFLQHSKSDQMKLSTPLENPPPAQVEETPPLDAGSHDSLATLAQTFLQKPKPKNFPLEFTSLGKLFPMCFILHAL
jgi:hypothetical protein